MSKVRKKWLIESSLDCAAMEECFSRAFFRPKRGMTEVLTGIQWGRSTVMDDYSGKEMLAAKIVNTRGVSSSMLGATIAITVEPCSEGGSRAHMFLYEATKSMGMVNGGAKCQKYMNNVVANVRELDSQATVEFV